MPSFLGFHAETNPYRYSVFISKKLKANYFYKRSLAFKVFIINYSRFSFTFFNKYPIYCICSLELVI